METSKPSAPALEAASLASSPSRDGSDSPRRGPRDEVCSSPSCSYTSADSADVNTWTFSSAGWLFTYFFGVIKCIKQLNLQRDIYAIGSSGGACAGCLLQFDCDMEDVVRHVMRDAVTARKNLTGAFDLKKYLTCAFERFAPDDAADRLSGRLEMSVTKLFPGLWPTNVRVRSFKSREHVKEAMLASSCITPLAGPPMWMKGTGLVMDGGLTDFQIMKGVLGLGSFFSFQEDHVVSVCPFYCSRADIRPSRYVPVWWAVYPPEPQELYGVFELGFHDAFHYLMSVPTKLRRPPACLEHEDVHTTALHRRLVALRRELKARVEKATKSGIRLARGSAEAAWDSLERTREQSAVAGARVLAAGRAGAHAASHAAGHALHAGVDSVCHGGAVVKEGLKEAQAQAQAQLSRAGAGAAERYVILKKLAVDGAERAAARAQAGVQDIEDVLAGLAGAGRVALRSGAWAVVLWEVWAQSIVSGAITAAGPVLPKGTSSEAWRRCKALSQNLLNTKLYLKTIPLAGSYVQIEEESDVDRSLREHSFAYRFLYWVL